jgi:hypothetical protein
VAAEIYEKFNMYWVIREITGLPKREMACVLKQKLELEFRKNF